jgi:four helix bundle protein
MSEESVFEHERLDVYRLGVEFIAWTEAQLDDWAGASEMLDEPSRALLAWIAEGSCKRTSAERLRFYDMARGAAVECAADLDVLVARGCALEQNVRHGKHLLARIVSLLAQEMARTAGADAFPHDWEN